MGSIGAPAARRPHLAERSTAPAPDRACRPPRCPLASFRPGDAVHRRFNGLLVAGRVWRDAPGGGASGAGVMEVKGAWDDEPAGRSGPAVERARQGGGPSFGTRLAVHRGTELGGR